MIPYYATPDGKVTLYAGHVIDVLREMPAESVNCVVTSPPYWSLRKYDCEPVVWGGDSACEHEWIEKAADLEVYRAKGRWQHGLTRAPEAYAEGTTRDLTSVADPNWARISTQGATCRLCGAWLGQYGLEPTPELYVEHTLMWLREVRRVLRKDGTLWLNMGDGYAGSGQGQSDEKPGAKQATNSGSVHGLSGTRHGNGLKPKDAVLMPFRVALAAQADGWWVRSVIIWAKPNPMPESVRDRPTDAHEYIFLLTRSKNYWYDADAVREEAQGRECTGEREVPILAYPGEHQAYSRGASGFGNNPNGRNCRSVWQFPTEPFPDAHFAVFPRELPERCIKAGCPEWVCPKCGKARTRVTEKTYSPTSRTPAPNKGRLGAPGERAANMTRDGFVPNRDPSIETLGWTDCGCGEPFIGGVVLDPFVGSGTTCEVAYHLGRTAIGIDASAMYLDMAIGRVKQGALL